MIIRAISPATRNPRAKKRADSIKSGHSARGAEL
jgi:hypothetical protein